MCQLIDNSTRGSKLSVDSFLPAVRPEGSAVFPAQPNGLGPIEKLNSKGPTARQLTVVRIFGKPEAKESVPLRETSRNRVSAQLSGYRHTGSKLRLSEAPTKILCGLAKRSKPDANAYGLALAILFVLLTLTGCGNLKSDADEPEHSNPAHWPVSLLDAAEKIDLRVEKLAKLDAKDLRDELNDLIEWAPEIAADTDLDEADWNEVYRLSETLRTHLASQDVPLGDYQQDFSRLSELLREFHRKLSEGLGSKGIGEATDDQRNSIQASGATEAATQTTSEVQ